MFSRWKKSRRSGRVAYFLRCLAHPLPIGPKTVLEVDSKEEDEVTCLMKKSYYKVSPSFGLTLGQLFSVKGVLDTPAGPSTIHVKHLPTTWKRFSSPYKVRSRLLHASRNPIRPLAVASLHLRVENLSAKVQLLVMDNLANSFIFATSFIYLFLKAVLPSKRKVLLYESPSVAILSMQRATKKMDQKEPTVFTKVRVARTLSIPGMSTVVVQVQTDASGLQLIQKPRPRAMKELILMANGVKYILPNQHFPIMVSNFSSRKVKLRKNQVLGDVLPAPQAIFAIQPEEKVLLDKEEEPTWKYTVDIGVQDPQTREQDINMLD